MGSPHQGFQVLSGSGVAPAEKQKNVNETKSHKAKWRITEGRDFKSKSPKQTLRREENATITLLGGVVSPREGTIRQGKFGKTLVKREIYMSMEKTS